MSRIFRKLFSCLYRARCFQEQEDLIPEARRASLPKDQTTIVISRASESISEKRTARIDCCSTPRNQAKKSRSRLRRPGSKNRTKKRPNSLATVTEEEEEAFSHQLALLDDEPEWDPNAGIGSAEYETGAITPPAIITTARASSPSNTEKITETSKKNLQKLVAKVHIFMDKDFVQQGPSDRANPSFKPIQKSKSAPNLTVLGGKGLAGSISSLEHSLSEAATSTMPHTPHSWRIPPKKLAHMPHIREPVIPSDVSSHYFEPKHHEYSVMARTMWKDGEIRFEDQWGRRLVPVGRQDSFAFELWPVPEAVEEGDDKKSQSSEEPEDLIEEDRIRWRLKREAKGKNSLSS